MRGKPPVPGKAYSSIVSLLLILGLLIGPSGCALLNMQTSDAKISAKQNEIRELFKELNDKLQEADQVSERLKDDPVAAAAFEKLKYKVIIEILAELIQRHNELKVLFATWSERAELEAEQDKELTGIKEEMERETERLNALHQEAEQLDLDLAAARALLMKNPNDQYCKEQMLLALEKSKQNRAEIRKSAKKLTKLAELRDGITSKYDKAAQKVITEYEPACFAGETLVLRPGGQRTAIRELREGDQVLSYDQASGQLKPRLISKFIQARGNHHYLINGSIKVTEAHRVLSGQNTWLRVRDLKPGMTIQSPRGPVTIKSIAYKKGPLTVYNFDVARDDNFLVLDGDGAGLVVHNGGTGK